MGFNNVFFENYDPRNHPCKDCKDRHVGCHGMCSDYQEWRKMYTELQKNIRYKKHQKGIGYLGEHFRRNCK